MFYLKFALHCHVDRFLTAMSKITLWFLAVRYFKIVKNAYLAGY